MLRKPAQYDGPDLGPSHIMRIENLPVCVAAVCVGFFQTDGAAAGQTPAPEKDDSSTAAEAPVFVPPEDGYDWIQLTSGEWLKGELIGVFDDEVEFDSDSTVRVFSASAY